MHSTLPEVLEHAAETGRSDLDGIRFLDRHERETWMSWQTLANRASRAAGALIRLGVRPGDRVAIVLPTGPSFFDAYLGCQCLGAIPVPLYPPIRLGRLDEYIQRTAAMVTAVGAQLLITEARIRSVLAPLRSKTTPPLRFQLASGLLKGQAAAFHPSQPDDVAMIQFSSGTTRDPKPVALTHAQILSNARPILDMILSFGQEEPGGVSWLPLYHDMGLIGCLLPAMMAPGPLTLIPPEVFLRRPAIWLNALSRFPGTVSPAPDFAYALCVERIREDELEGIDLSRWRMALNGAEPISPTNLRAFQERFAPYGLAECALTPVYGLSEASLAVTFSSIHEPFTAMRFDQDALSQGFVRLQSDGVELVSVGQPLPGVQVEIRSEAGEALEQQEGRIWVKGPSVMHGYYNRTETPIVDHWLDTGDLGFLFDDHLFVTGRAKDVIILRGRNHAPHAIESAVSSVDGIRTGCVVAVGDIQPEGERLLVFAEVREACEDLGERCAQAIRGQCGVSPDQVHLLAPGTLPRTSSGKLRRGETLRRHRTQSLTTPEAVTPIALASILARGTWRLVRDSRR